MAGRKLVKSVVSAALALTLAAAFPFVPPSASAATGLGTLQQKQAQLKKQQDQVAAKLKTLKADKSKKLQYKQTLDEQADTVEKQVDVLNAQIAAYDADIAKKETQIAGKQKEITDNQEKLKQRLRAMYLMGEASNLEIVLNAKSVLDLAEKAEAVRAITAHDTELINTLKADITGIKTQKSEIESSRKSVAAAKVSLDQKRQELTALTKETQTVIAEISQNESSAKQENAQLAEERAKADAAIDQWYKDYYARQAQQNSSGGGKTGGSAGNNSASGGYVSSGRFTWPVPGIYTVTSGFGPRWGKLHKGIDISSPGSSDYGKPIVAADSGRVMMAGWGVSGSGYGGYGNVIMIDHGGGYSTLYAHCSGVAVSAGSVVKKGQVIGYIGNSGDSDGAHLHFEIRVNGVAKNPLNWL